tara:strand:+ start:275 stop:565 length:291 start_codon:yes stop_codon:yes gene_type:complete
MGGVTPNTKLKRPDDTRTNRGISTPTFAEDDVDSLMRARQGYVKNTGGTLRDVTTAGNYKKLTERQKKEYKKRNPGDFKKEKDKGFKLSSKTLLGG